MTRSVAAATAALLVLTIGAAGCAVDGTSSAAQPPANLTDLTDLTDRDRELIDFAQATTELGHQLSIETIWSAVYSSTNRQRGTDQLKAQRARTDAALASFQAKVQEIDPGRESQHVRDVLRQNDNRIKNMSTIRRSVDAIQADGIKLVDDYTATRQDLLAVERSVVATLNSPKVFRLLWSHVSLGNVLHFETTTAAFLTISVEIGFYAKALPTGSNPTATREDMLGGPGCGDDAAAAGAQCQIYEDTVKANEHTAWAEDLFEAFASGEQKQTKRFADTGNRFDELKQTALQDGNGANNLGPYVPEQAGPGYAGTVAIDRDEFIAAAIARIDKLAEAERQILAEGP